MAPSRPSDEKGVSRYPTCMVSRFPVSAALPIRGARSSTVSEVITPEPRALVADKSIGHQDPNTEKPGTVQELVCCGEEACPKRATKLKRSLANSVRFLFTMRLVFLRADTIEKQ